MGSSSSKTQIKEEKTPEKRKREELGHPRLTTPDRPPAVYAAFFFSLIFFFIILFFFVFFFLFFGVQIHADVNATLHLFRWLLYQ